MASPGFVNALIGTLDDRVKRVLTQVFEYVLRELRWGQPDNQETSENMAGAFFTVTTSSVANQEVALQHGIGVTPYFAMPVMNPGSSGTQIVELAFPRVADDQYLYVSSPSTGIVVTFYLEA